MNEIVQYLALATVVVVVIAVLAAILPNIFSSGNEALIGASNMTVGVYTNAGMSVADGEVAVVIHNVADEAVTVSVFVYCSNRLVGNETVIIAPRSTVVRVFQSDAIAQSQWRSCHAFIEENGRIFYTVWVS